MLACVLALVGVLPALASAHPGYAGVDRLDDRVRMTFDAPLEEAFLRLEVRAASGRVVSGPPRRDPRDPRAVVAGLVGDPGPDATVTWRVMAHDGHAQGGVVRLADGAPVPGADAGVRPGNAPLALIARILLLLGPIIVAGAMVLAGGILAPSVRDGGVRAPGGGDDRAEFAARAGAALVPAATAWWRIIGAAAGIWFIGLFLHPAAVLVGLGAGAGGLGDLLTQTRLGAAWWVQVAAFAVVAGVTMIGARGRTGPRAFPSPALCASAAVAASAALLAISWSGHASTGKDRWANIVIDALHNLATAAWIGGLFALVAILPAIARRLGEGDRLRLSAGVVVRFSGLAVAAVAVLVVTGVYRALAELGDAGDLLDTAYGVALLVKLALFGGLLVMGAVNRFVYHPRLERAALGLDPDDRGAAERLAVSVRAEVLLALALILAVGVMIGLPPPG